MIVLDTETTGLLQPELAGLHMQPHIIEFAAVKYETAPWIGSRELVERETLHFLCKPPVMLEPKITKLTGITNAMLVTEKPFSYYVHHVQNFFCGELNVWGHNLNFDLSVLKFELQRLGLEYHFPWPMYHHCTVERTSHLGLADRKLTTLHAHVMGEPLAQTHRALDDVRVLARIIQRLESAP